MPRPSPPLSECSNAFTLSSLEFQQANEKPEDTLLVTSTKRKAPGNGNCAVPDRV